MQDEDDGFAADAPQPTNSKREVEFRRFDKTQLHEAQHGHYAHRDYFSHWARWGFATRFIGNDDRVLDVGCGQDQPLVKNLNHFKHAVPLEYVGVDINKITKKTGIAWTKILDETNILDVYSTLGKFDRIVCFEVIEHMHTCDGKRLLKAFKEMLRDDNARAMLSTPCFNGKAAANHIHEYTQLELWEYIQEAGMVVEERFGTFANYNDIKKVATKDEMELLNYIRKFYSDEVASCFLAPKYPDASRNNCWVLRLP